MAMKRTSLDSLLPTAEKEEIQTFPPEIKPKTFSEAIEKPKIKIPAKQSIMQQSAAATKSKGGIIKQTVYLPSAVHEQLRQLAFEERRKMHDYLVEGLDRVFKNRGLKPYIELSDETK